MREPRHQTKPVRPQAARVTERAIPRSDPGTMCIPPPCFRMRRPTDQRLARLIQIVAASPRINIKQLSRELCLSKSRIEHLFKSQTGIALKTYLVAHRLAYAARLLLDGRLSVKEVAQRSGYAHTGSLTRAFGSAYGLNPTEYQSGGHPASKNEKVKRS